MKCLFAIDAIAAVYRPARKKPVRVYLANVVRLQAAIAFGENSEAGLHTRMLAAKSIADIAGAIPQSPPVAPPLDSPGNGSGQA